MKMLLAVFLGMVMSVQGAEWMTSGGDHCIERCHVGTRKEMDSVLWCKVVDGVATEHRPGQDEESLTEEDKYMWDYCTQAKVEVVEDGDGYQETGEAVVLPERVNRTKRETGGSGGFFNPGTTGLAAASLAGINCAGPCTENYGGKYTCDVPGSNPNNFFCSPNVPLKREQLTSHNKLWCTSACNKGSGDDFYECKTLFGYDRCSPQGDRSASGKTCFSPCQPDYSSDHQHYQCYTDEAKEQLEDCGYWYVAGAKKEALEYTNNDEVCAGPCLEQDGDLVCSYVDWQWNQDEMASSLQMSLGSCGPQSGMSWTTIGIIIGCVVAAVIIVALIAFFVSKRKYSQAATQEY